MRRPKGKGARLRPSRRCRRLQSRSGSSSPVASRPLLSRGIALRQELRLQNTARSTLAIRYGFRKTQIEEFPDFQSQRAGVIWRRQVTRYGGLRLGYEHERTSGTFITLTPGSLGIGEPVRLHNLDTGLDYRRPLSFSRRTTVGISSGMAVSTQLGRRFFTVTGVGTIDHQIGRSWTASTEIRRGLRVLQSIGAPALENVVRARLVGWISTRIDILASTDYTSGRVNPVADTADAGFTTYSATLRLRYALSRFVAAYGEYGYYRSDFGAGVAFPTDFPSSVNRRSGRIGLTLYAPLAGSRTGRVDRVTR